MSVYVMAVVGAGVFVVIVVGILIALKVRPVKLNKTFYTQKWKELQRQCSDKGTWSLAIIDADKLLDHALKKHHYKGKSMGERLVKAQRKLTDNDKVWFGHKLRNRLVHEQDVLLKEADVRQALLGIRQALKDLGALE